MTETVNRQALLEDAKSVYDSWEWELLADEMSSYDRASFNILLHAYRRMFQYILSIPSTPVQGHLPALLEKLKAREQEVKAKIATIDPDKHIFLIGLESVRLSEVQRSIKEAEALSQPDIQPSTEDDQPVPSISP